MIVVWCQSREIEAKLLSVKGRNRCILPSLHESDEESKICSSLLFAFLPSLVCLSYQACTGILSCPVSRCHVFGVTINIFAHTHAYSSRGPAVPYSAVKIACHDLVVQSTVLFTISRDSAGSHFSAGIVVWQGTAPMRGHDCISKALPLPRHTRDFTLTFTLIASISKDYEKVFPKRG